MPLRSNRMTPRLLEEVQFDEAESTEATPAPPRATPPQQRRGTRLSFGFLIFLIFLMLLGAFFFYALYS